MRHGGARRQPEQLLELWDFEGCPYCRKVREALSELDLDWVCHPAARGSGHRRDTPDWGGRKSYPHLVDPNTGVSMKESEAILDYLHDTYGAGRPHSHRLTARLDTVGSIVASAIRPRGLRTRYGDRMQPRERLVLYQSEGCPYCRKVRERLSELDLAFEVRNVPYRGRRRPELRERGGKAQVPYFVDPNTGAEMYESDDIVAYLDAVYAK
ncbi:MAG: glutathione S-transferase N-terminal domain-containing protein [Sandaracinaceae bacterium]|nr:glutathione S-transferase N-terminal domain-containing protein [Sandaracinaceae bacterium]